MKPIEDSMPAWSKPAPALSPEKCMCGRDNCEIMLKFKDAFKTCSCHLVEGEWGRSGWHWSTLQNGADLAFSRCPSYWAAAQQKLREKGITDITYRVDGVRLIVTKPEVKNAKHDRYMQARENR